MKNVKRILLIALLLSAASCSRPKEIPDRKLQDIFTEIFLVNTYCNIETVNTDSLNIYEPVLRKYGYRPRDLVHTLRTFSQRKSSRLSDILNQSIEQLDKQYNVYARQVAILDTIELIARERYRKVVHTDTLIRATSLRDTSRLRIRVPAREGQYKISYSYFVDSLDRNPSVRATHVLTDSAGRQLEDRMNWMRRRERGTFDVTLTAPANTSRLEIVLGNYVKTSSAPDLRIDTLVVIYYPPTKAAVDSLTRDLIMYKLVIDGKEYPLRGAADSLSLRIDPPRIAPRRDSVR